MPTDPAEPLSTRHCRPCEGGVEKLAAAELRPLLDKIPDWRLDDSANSIYRKFKLRDFASAMALLNRVAAIAEDEQHHPDLHLSGYRNVRIELTTHAIGGLSENDFILAAKIDEIAAAPS